MSRNDFERLFNQLDSYTVGFGPLFRDFHLTTANYPPHNIVAHSDNKFVLELAVAGFKKSEISIQESQGLLTVKGSKNEDTPEYQYRGIATRDFEKSFRIADYFKVSDASLEDGILSVTFYKEVPEQDKPKLIAIK
jgi:molecular chaperone IbpA